MSTSMNLTLTRLLGKSPAEASNEEIYTALLRLIQEKSARRTADAAGRKLYYISAEFLIGKLLSNNLINLGLYDEVRSTLAEAWGSAITADFSIRISKTACRMNLPITG